MIKNPNWQEATSWLRTRGPFLESPEKPFVKLLTAYFGEPIFKRVFKVRKRKITGVWRLNSSPFLRYKGNCDTRKWPVKFRDFRETGPRGQNGIWTRGNRMQTQRPKHCTMPSRLSDSFFFFTSISVSFKLSCVSQIAEVLATVQAHNRLRYLEGSGCKSPFSLNRELTKRGRRRLPGLHLKIQVHVIHITAKLFHVVSR